MNPYNAPSSGHEPEPALRATSVRHAVLLATMLAAFLMYLDRVCIGWIIESESFKSEIQLDPPELTPEQQSAGVVQTQAKGSDYIKEAFFWAYALAQVPAGWLAERFGKRMLMSLLILLWSAFTALTSFATGIEVLLIARIGCGLAQAGAYPIASSLISRWVNRNWRGLASSIVSLGGRLGGTLAPLITAFIIVQSNNWRMAGWVYGAVGILVAITFWIVFRETPEEHPSVNAAEAEYLAEGRPPQKGKHQTKAFPLRAVLTDVSLWLMCAVQFLTNVGWVFVINSLPSYFKNVLHLSDEANGMISTVTLFVSFFGLIAGGFITDFCGRYFGIKNGRMLPIMVTRFLAAGFFLLCLTTSNPWLLAIYLGLMAFSTDAGIPAMWAYSQDVGGRQVAPILGWANMWGNFGAALQPRLITLVNQNFDANGDYHEAFIFSAGAFALSGLLSLGINAARPVTPDDA